MRLRTTAAVAATSALGAGAVALAAGRYAGTSALRPEHDAAEPAAVLHSRTARGALPAGFEGPSLTVRAVHGDRVELAQSRGLHGGPDGLPVSRLPGIYGLTGRGCHAVVGPVLEAETARAAEGTVVRRLEQVVRGALEPGATVWLTPQAYAGTPHGALGIDHQDLSIPGELGPLPAWFVPGRRDVWIVAVHGLGATTEQPMNVLPAYHRKGLPVLALGYRGDPGAPPVPGGVRYLGGTEWRDVEAAIRWALRNGAVRVVLHGWSAGATVALRTAAELALPPGTEPDEGPRGRISGLVLDSPVLDWRATLRSLASSRRLPRPLLPLAVRAAQGRAGVRADRLTAALKAPDLDLPTLLLHGPDDAVAPWASSRAFVEEREELVSLCSFPQAPHAAMWNSDPKGYQETLRRFLTPLM